MKFAKIVLVTLAVVGSVAVAYAKGERTVPEAMARAQLMDDVRTNMGVLGGMAEGKVAFDAAAAAAARDALIADADKISEAFAVQGADDPASEAKPEIWTDWDAFLVKAGGLKSAAEAVDTTSLDTVKAGLGGLGGACKACHQTYRE
ncbi:MAG: cytochrome c [Rhodobacteraceae bacterium]|jgi:cytochrome c556|nr:cytochrome c [Paracoccaceae bacterium]